MGEQLHAEANDDDHQNQFDMRVDGARGQHDRGFARYTYYHEVENPVTPLPDGSGAISGSILGTGNVTSLTNILGQQVVLNETHTFSPALLNKVRLGYTRRGNSQLGATVNWNRRDLRLGFQAFRRMRRSTMRCRFLRLQGLQQLGSSGERLLTVSNGSRRACRYGGSGRTGPIL